MRRQRRMQHYSDDDEFGTVNTVNLRSSTNGFVTHSEDVDDFIQMKRHPNSRSQRFENTIEAKVEEGDTLQALALKFHCTVADIKRLNKIDKENEIFARKVIKIPLTVHSVLLGTTVLPTVHTSGNSSPKHPELEGKPDKDRNIVRNPLEDANAVLNEKLLVASVNSAGHGNDISDLNSSKDGASINRIILNSKISATGNPYTDEDVSRVNATAVDQSDATAPLIDDFFDDEYVTRLRPIPGPSIRVLDWSGSDCDMSWICLLVFILALCFVIPLLLILHFTEHPHQHHSALRSNLTTH